MSKIIIFILAIAFSTAAYATCSFDWDADCSAEYNAIFNGEQNQGGGGDCMCTETSSSSSSTVWVPNPSGNGGNYETVTTPGTTRQVPCPCY